MATRSIRSASTRCVFSRSIWCRKPTVDIRAFRSMPRRWRMFCGRAISSTTLTIRTGSIATASCCRRGMGRRSYTVCCTSDRLRSLAGRHQAVSPMGKPHAGTSRTRSHARRRSHDRTARAGTCERGRHGHRRSASRGALQPRRPRAHRSSNLGHRQRWRSDGRRRLRSGLARRASQARQADLPLRRQSRDARCRHGHYLLRGSRKALRGVWLATFRVDDGNDVDAIARGDRQRMSPKSRGLR